MKLPKSLISRNLFLLVCIYSDLSTARLNVPSNFTSPATLNATVENSFDALAPFHGLLLFAYTEKGIVGHFDQTSLGVNETVFTACNSSKFHVLSSSYAEGTVLNGTFGQFMLYSNVDKNVNVTGVVVAKNATGAVAHQVLGPVEMTYLRPGLTKRPKPTPTPKPSKTKAEKPAESTESAEATETPAVETPVSSKPPKTKSAKPSWSPKPTETAESSKVKSSAVKSSKGPKPTMSE